MSKVQGITMLLRLKDEEEWIKPCVESIQWADQLVYCFQNSTDKTEEIIRDVSYSKKSHYFHYPHDSRPNGPGHLNQPYDEFNRAYFYNWCYHKTNTKYIVKWDGDMVAFDDLENILRKSENKFDFVTFAGINIITDNGKFFYNKKTPYCGAEPRFIKGLDEDPWKTGELCEAYAYKIRNNLTIKEPMYLHFKYSKSIESMTKAWPENWRDIPHFQKLLERENKTDLVPYNGDIPKWIKV